MGTTFLVIIGLVSLGLMFGILATLLSVVILLKSGHLGPAKKPEPFIPNRAPPVQTLVTTRYRPKEMNGEYNEDRR